MTEGFQIPVSGVDWDSALSSVRAARIKQETGEEVKAPRWLTKEEWPPDYDAVRAWRKVQLARFEANPKLIKSAKAYYKNRPIEFICHWCDVYEPRNANNEKPMWMPFILFERQKLFIDFIEACIKEQQPGLCEKSRTMGATWTAVGWSVHRWLFHEASAIGWGSQNAPSVDRLGDPKSIFEKIRLLIGRLPPVFLPKDLQPEHLKQYVCSNPENGSSIVGEVGNNIGRGGRTLVYFKDESAHYAQPEKVEASLSENTNTPIDISSVSGPGTLFHRKRESGVEWEPGKWIERGYPRVFIMDWSDHPEHSSEWYHEKKQSAIRQSTPHIFAQEIERNYAASQAGVIIQSEWIAAAIDADEVLELSDAEDGGWGGALDVADADTKTADRNALSLRKGIVLKSLEEWSERDTGATARRAIKTVKEWNALPLDLQYDCIGVGVGVKAEFNRLEDDALLPAGLKLVPWNAGDTCRDPYGHVDPDDEDSPLNRALFENLKAQGWWSLGRRFYMTYRAVMCKKGTPLPGDEDFRWNTDDLIVIPSTLPLKNQLVKELSQPTMTQSTRLRMMINKTPEGTRSPNLADSVMMDYWPVEKSFMGIDFIAAPRIITAD